MKHMKLHENHGDLAVLAVQKTFVTLVPLCEKKQALDHSRPRGYHDLVVGGVPTFIEQTR